MTASANFTVNGNAVPPELGVLSGSTVTLALTSISGVRTVVWSIVGNSSHTLVNPTIIPGGSPSGATATFTMPVGSGQGYLVQCVVNGGVDDEGVYQSRLTKRAIVGVVDAAGSVPFCAGETTERSPTYGYVERLNQLASLGGTFSLTDNSVTFAKMQDIGVGLIGNDSGTADPKLITLGSGLAFSAGALVVSAVAISALASIANNTFLGNISGGSAAPVALTATQVTANLNVFVASGASHAKGLVPDPGASAGSTKFLREDASWAVPAGSFTNPATPGDDNKIAYANAGAIGWRAGVTTPNANQLAFTAETTNSNLRFEHNTNVATGKDSGGGGYRTLVRWGVTANDELAFGGSGSSDPASILQQTRASTGSFTTKIGTSIVAATIAAGTALTSLVGTGTVASSFSVTDAAHTALTASTERNSVLFDLGQTRQWATGALTNQRSLRVIAPTLAFVGASTVTTAATVAISNAPQAGTNATLTQSLALWIEAGGIGFGSSAALTGLTRFAHNTQAVVGRSSTSTDINLVRWGASATDELALGDDGAASLLLSATTSLNMRLGAASEWTFSTTQLDCHSNNFVNLNSINGIVVPNGALGSALGDASVTITVAGGNVYELSTALTANRSVQLGVTGGPVDGELISIRRYTTAAFTLTINDDGGNPLYTFPASQKRIAEFVYSSATGHFKLSGHMKLT